MRQYNMKNNILNMTQHYTIYRGYYTVSKRYGFYLRVAKISYQLSAAKRVRCFGHEKIKSISLETV